MLVNIRHAKHPDLNYCAKGCREFCKKHGIDVKAFMTVGVPEEEFLKTGDAMAIKLVEKAREIEYGNK